MPIGFQYMPIGVHFMSVGFYYMTIRYRLLIVGFRFLCVGLCFIAIGFHFMFIGFRFIAVGFRFLYFGFHFMPVRLCLGFFKMRSKTSILHIFIKLQRYSQMQHLCITFTLSNISQNDHRMTINIPLINHSTQST